jgi:hypothetical protein
LKLKVVFMFNKILNCYLLTDRKKLPLSAEPAYETSIAPSDVSKVE